MRNTIEYPQLIEQAMRRVVESALKIVERDGLPGAHHFFMVFDTRHPDVDVADWIKITYPESMTIVLQHWFASLEVSDQGFSVTLNFNNNPEPLYIPFDALLHFEDPSCDFKLGFKPVEHAKSPALNTAGPEPEVEKEPEPSGDSSVVQLDRFR